MNIAILSSLSILAFIRKKKIYAIFLIVFLWVLFAFQYGNADYFSYENMYQHFAVYDTSNSFSNIGYKILCRVFFSFGIKYDQFLVIEATVGLLIIAYVIFKNCKYPGIVLVLYTIYPYIMDTVQIRNFLAESIILLGISLYINQAEFRGYIHMGICLVIASLIHVSALVYLVLLLIPALKKKYLKIIIGFAVVFEFVLIAYIKEFVAIMQLGDHVSSYFYKSISPFTAVFLTLYFISAAAILNCVQNISLRNNQYTKWNAVVSRVNILMLPFIPLCFVTNDFQRIYRNVFVLSYIAVVNLYYSGNKNKVSFPHVKVETMLLVATFGYAIVSNIVFVTLLYWDTVVAPLFENNLLFG